MDNKKIVAIHFNSGCSIYFKTYKQSATDLQTGTCFSVFCDEELPVELLPEIQARLNASDGYFHLVFTATLGQEHWRKCMEEQGKRDETHRGALKLNVSLFDCMEFEDGSPSHWTKGKIDRAIAKCPSKQEVQRRIYGRFVVSEGLKYAAYDHERNRGTSGPVPSNWVKYAAVDVGSGGEKGHPAAIIFIAVAPDYKQGRVFRGWRGDGINTTAQDILLKYRSLRGDDKIIGQVYDWASKDFFNIASRLGESFQPAEKNHEIGEGIVNTLFRSGMLKIDDGDPELEKLITEICSLQNDTPKNKAKDDLCDALRYNCSQIPWDWAAVEENIDLAKLYAKDLNPVRPKVLSHEEQIDKDRNDERLRWLNGEEQGVEDELNEWAAELEG